MAATHEPRILWVVGAKGAHSVSRNSIPCTCGDTQPCRSEVGTFILVASRSSLANTQYICAHSGGGGKIAENHPSNNQPYWLELNTSNNTANNELGDESCHAVRSNQSIKNHLLELYYKALGCERLTFTCVSIKRSACCSID